MAKNAEMCHIIESNDNQGYLSCKIEMHSERYSCLFSLISKETAHPLVAISLEGETLRRRRCWQREQQLCHLRGTIQLGPMPLLRQEREV